ncbi:hypothetical protein [Bacillus sp. FJAT-29937]|uniref:hypothetical protein n=1 Tax=Bacillus sp. FJAT-29937 TaxID=1720553 RepID=UPI00082FC291|nr:hypothetical protein [Bacillus sp. FJAT-29937]
MEKQTNLDIESLKLQLEEQIEAVCWFQAMAAFSKAILVSKLYSISDDKQDSEPEKKILFGLWVQAIGQLIEALGVTKELSALDQEQFLNSQRIAVAGDFFQSFGAQVEVIGGIGIIKDELTGVTEFVP